MSNDEVVASYGPPRSLFSLALALYTNTNHRSMLTRIFFHGVADAADDVVERDPPPPLPPFLLAVSHDVTSGTGRSRNRHVIARNDEDVASGCHVTRFYH